MTHNSAAGEVIRHSDSVCGPPVQDLQDMPSQHYDHADEVSMSKVSEIDAYRPYLQGEINFPSTSRCLKYSVDCYIDKVSENLPVSVFKKKTICPLVPAETYDTEPVL